MKKKKKTFHVHVVVEETVSSLTTKKISRPGEWGMGSCLFTDNHGKLPKINQSID